MSLAWQKTKETPMSSNESTDRNDRQSAIPQDDPPRRTRADIARENGARSRGPITDVGKQRVSENALKHGLYARRMVIRGESWLEFAELVSSLIDDVNADGELELQLVSQMAAGIWKRKRYERMEAQLFADALGDWEKRRGEIDPEPDAEGVDRAPMTYWDVVLRGDTRRWFEGAQQAQARAIRQFSRALADLAKARKGNLGSQQLHDSDGTARHVTNGADKTEEIERVPARGVAMHVGAVASGDVESLLDREWAARESGDSDGRDGFEGFDGRDGLDRFDGSDPAETNPAEPATTRGEGSDGSPPAPAGGVPGH
jgi:hypothetical protein